MNTHLFSEKGKRESNQDYILSKECNPGSSIHIVADGMGGYEKGLVAAQAAANTIADNLTDRISEKNDEVILDAIIQANNEIAQIKIKENIKMGTTIAGVHIQKNQFLAFWVGDVKIIHISNNQIVFESKDHSLINQLKDTDLNPSATALDNIRHIVTRSIQGENSKFQPDYYSGKIKPEDKILICSDGFLELIGNNNINNISPEKLKELKKIAQHANDNASAILLEF
jgi:protein phosphatase